MLKKLIFISIIAIAIFSISSCTDFIAVNLSKQSVTLLAPANNTIATSYSQTFWWQELKGADSYNLQIVKPSFASVQSLVLDTIVTTHQFTYILQPGKYQWRLRALNPSSTTDYVTYNLTIDSSQNLAGQTLLLISPADNYYSNVFIQNFSWFAMPNANNYVFQILSPTEVPIGNPQSVTTTAATYTFTVEGIYKWRVFAQNGQSSSSYAERTITIDTTRPVVPVVAYLPLNDTTTSNPIPLAWNSAEANATYRVLISSDSTFTGVAKDTTTASTIYKFYNATIGQYYYWKVRAIDAAGNVGAYCARRRIKRM